MSAHSNAPHIRSVELKNIRGFREVEVELTNRITVIIGKNGTNKTTLLRGLAVALAGPIDGQALLSQPTGGLVANDQFTASVRLTLDTGSELGVDIERHTSSEVLLPRTSPGDDNNVFACAYGAGRGVIGTDSGRDYRVLDAVASLFDYRRELVDPELTLRRLRDHIGTRRYEATMEGIKGVLGLQVEDEIQLPTGGGVAVTGPQFGGSIPLAGWADGYRLTFTWLLDLFGWALRADRIDEDGNVRGILIVDEIDQHLHPALQAAVVSEVSDLLPKAQIIMTTHSPLVALGATPDQLVVLRRRNDRVVIDPDVPDYRAWSAEDMLADDRLFDSDVHAPEMTKHLEDYDRLVRTGPERRTKSEEKELARLASIVRGGELPQALQQRVDEATAAFEQRVTQA